MKSITYHNLSVTKKHVNYFTFFLLMFYCYAVFAENQMTVSTNLPEVKTATITVGIQQSIIEFDVQAVDSIMLTVIAPVDGGSFSLIDPDGNIAVNNNTVDFYSGTNYTPALPGGVFSTGEIVNPKEGTWSIRLDFPAAQETTAIQATISKKSRYQVGIALTRNHVNTGEDVPLGLIVLDNGIPIQGLTPSFSIEKNGVEIASGITGQDDGVGVDGLINDGIYSNDFIFPSADSYKIVGHVEIPTSQGTVTRTVSASIQVSDPGFIVNSTENVVLTNASGCIESLAVRLNVDIKEASIFNAKALLRSQDNKILETTAEFPAITGTTIVDLIFPVDTIRETLGSSEPYEIINLEIVEFEDTPKLTYLSNVVSPFTGVAASNFCVEPVVITATLQEEAVLTTAGLISGININFPITVQTAGNYRVSYKVIGSNGEDLGLFTFSQQLDVGENIFMSSVDAQEFVNIDGPFSIISLLVDGSGGTAQLSLLGTTQFYSGNSFVGATVIVTVDAKPIPTLQEWGIIVLTLIMGMVALRRFSKSIR